MACMSARPSWRRLWQPHRALFWLMLAFNGLSSAMAWYLNLARPQGVLLVLLTIMALGNALMGMWLLWRLWAESPSETTQGDTHVQVPADRQER
jgi:hypothetical protein